MKELASIFLFISLRDFIVIVAIFLSIVLSWVWGAILKAALGISRWYGCLAILPGVNVIVFLAAGYFSHRKLTAEANEIAFQQVKRMVEEMAVK